MKLKTFVLGLCITIAGCSYDLDQVEASKAACKAKSGHWQFARNGLQSFCTIDNIRYVYDRDSGTFKGGYFAK